MSTLRGETRKVESERGQSGWYSRDVRAALQSIAAGIVGHAESIGVRLPHVLLVVVVLGHHGDAVGHQECRVESDSELTNHVVHLLRAALRNEHIIEVLAVGLATDRSVCGKVTHRLHILHLRKEICGTGFGDGAEVVNQVVASHADSRVNDVQQPLVRLRFDAYAHIVSGGEYVAVSQREQPDLIKGVRPVGDQLAQEYLQSIGGNQIDCNAQTTVLETNNVNVPLCSCIAS